MQSIGLLIPLVKHSSILSIAHLKIFCLLACLICTHGTNAGQDIIRFTFKMTLLSFWNVSSLGKIILSLIIHMKTPLSQKPEKSKLRRFLGHSRHSNLYWKHWVGWAQFKVILFIFKPLPVSQWKPHSSLLPIHPSLKLSWGWWQWCQSSEARFLALFKPLLWKQQILCRGERKFTPMSFAWCHPFPHRSNSGGWG